MEKGVCKNCKKKYEYNKSQNRGVFCCLDCCVEYQQNEALQSVLKYGTNLYTHHRKTLRRVLEYICNNCKCKPVWQGKELPLHLDHKDGNRKNNCIENLRWLCPNCHSQTETWTYKNVSVEGKKRMSDAGKKRMSQQFA